MKSFSLLNPFAFDVTASTTATQHAITMPTWAPKLARIAAATIVKSASSVQEVGVSTVTQLGLGNATTIADNIIALGDTFTNGATVIVEYDELGDNTVPRDAFAGISR